MGNNANFFAGTAGAGADATGLAWFAATGSTAPTDGTTALAAAWKNAGMISDNGLTFKFNETSKSVKAYGSTAIQRKVITDLEFSFTFDFLEVNATSMAVFNNVALTTYSPGVGTGAFSATLGTITRQLYAAVFDMIDGGNHIRLYCPTFEITGRTDVKFNSTDVSTWGCTGTAYPNTSGVAVQEYFVIAGLG